MKVGKFCVLESDVTEIGNYNSAKEPRMGLCHILRIDKPKRDQP